MSADATPNSKSDDKQEEPAEKHGSEDKDAQHKRGRSPPLAQGADGSVSPRSRQSSRSSKSPLGRDVSPAERSASESEEDYQPANPNCSVAVIGLTPNVTKEHLNEIVGIYSKVVNTHIVESNRGQRHAVVELESPAAAVDIAEALHTAQLDGQTLSVVVYSDSPKRNAYIAGIAAPLQPALRRPLQSTTRFFSKRPQGSVAAAGVSAGNTKSPVRAHRRGDGPAPRRVPEFVSSAAAASPRRPPSPPIQRGRKSPQRNSYVRNAPVPNARTRSPVEPRGPPLQRAPRSPSPARTRSPPRSRAFSRTSPRRLHSRSPRRKPSPPHVPVRGRSPPLRRRPRPSLSPVRNARHRLSSSREDLSPPSERRFRRRRLSDSSCDSRDASFSKGAPPSARHRRSQSPPSRGVSPLVKRRNHGSRSPDVSDSPHNVRSTTRGIRVPDPRPARRSPPLKKDARRSISSSDSSPPRYRNSPRRMRRGSPSLSPSPVRTRRPASRSPSPFEKRRRLWT
eukprot:Gregarina_sp_Poly_1__3361@NODE_196_length_11576_cov_92_095925_g175_i0_p3_GENE_NODE_196_length_11576_cov_92_095925_g175_i0NODE_196_length_11576_cov_92_095925_g175_i0_p3_ORF_typecomplete_len535_score82_62RRM_5/PF13893_6/4_4e07RRM_1/PF00076_22/2_8e06RRM_3/PF08777_11/0_0069RRM_occluded/PF16842_5/0_015RRM_8/PF11835_8/0_24_NODE_196_length_11576_cov_92_095925_g175_i0831606